MLAGLAAGVGSEQDQPASRRCGLQYPTARLLYHGIVKHRPESSAQGHGANAFFTNSSDCEGGPLATTLHVDSYQDPGSWTTDSTRSAGTPNFTDGTPDFNEANEGVSDAARESKTVESCEAAPQTKYGSIKKRKGKGKK